MSAALSTMLIKKYLNASPPLLENLSDPARQIQANGVDLSLGAVHTFTAKGQLDFSNRERVLADLSELEFERGWLNLAPGPYLITFNEIVNLPAHLMAVARPRSSLLRMGATVETAVWDAGYSGRSQCLLVVHNHHGLRLAQNARIIQMVFFNVAGVAEAYSGIYQRENI